MKPITVLSLFDGMSCGQIALERAGIPVNTYYASEIDKYAITVTQANYPNTVQLGDVTKWREWDLPKIDLILAGSPCQGFSNAGKMQAFDDPRSKLFFTFVDIKNHCEPTDFLLENVRMKQEWSDIITEHVGVGYIGINSDLVSAQRRFRQYWSSQGPISQPDDKCIYLKDILESGPVDYVKMTKKGVIRKFQEKASCLAGGAHSGGNHSDMDLLIIPEATKQGYVAIKNGDCFDMTFPGSKTRRGRSMKEKCNCLTAAKYDYMRYEGSVCRRLTPIECERLQTVPDNYTNHVSNTQRYKMLGNGWTVDVIVHILKGLLT